MGRLVKRLIVKQKVHERNIFHEAWLNDPLELLLSGQVSQKTNSERKIHEGFMKGIYYMRPGLMTLLSYFYVGR